jgi:hypothetical protein
LRAVRARSGPRSVQWRADAAAGRGGRPRCEVLHPWLWLCPSPAVCGGRPVVLPRAGAGVAVTVEMGDEG